MVVRPNENSPCDNTHPKQKCIYYNVPDEFINDLNTVCPSCTCKTIISDRIVLKARLIHIDECHFVAHINHTLLCERIVCFAGKFSIYCFKEISNLNF